MCSVQPWINFGGVFIKAFFPLDLSIQTILGSQNIFFLYKTFSLDIADIVITTCSTGFISILLQIQTENMQNTEEQQAFNNNGLNMNTHIWLQGFIMCQKIMKKKKLQIVPHSKAVRLQYLTSW